MLSALNKGEAADLAEAYSAAVNEVCWDEVFASNGMILDRIGSPPSSRGRYMMLGIILAEKPKGGVDLPAELKEFITSHADLTGGRVLKVTIYVPDQKSEIIWLKKGVTAIYEKDFFWWRLLYPYPQ